MRTNTRDLAHKFAENPFSAGTSSGAAHFADGTFYSYAAPLAVVDKEAWERGQRVVRFNTKRYSVTTSKHQTWLGGALSMAGFKVVDEEFPYDR